MLDHVETGAQTDHILTGRIGLFQTRYPDAESQIRFYESLSDRLAAIPGVQAATVSTSLPGTFVGFDFYVIDGAKQTDSDRPPVTHSVIAGATYFETFKIPIVQGRGFDSRDVKKSQPVAIVNQMFVQKSWPKQNPIGRRLRLGDPGEENDAPWLTVIGVVPNVLQTEIDEKMMPTVYTPVTQGESRFMSIAMRTSGDPMLIAGPMQKAVQELDSDLPVYWVRSLEDWLQIGRFNTRFLAFLFAFFALMALILAAGGQYAVLTYTVGQRTREIGVRRALGAEDSSVVKLLLGQGIVQFGIALLIGIPMAIGFATLISSILFGVKAFDPVTFLIVPVTLLLVCVTAAYFPAKRALRVDPAIALRSE